MSTSNYETLAKQDLISVIHEREHEIDKLHRLLKQAKDNLYGKKSEKLPSSVVQEPLFSFKAAPEQKLLENVIEIPAHTRRVSNPRRELPSDIERQRIEYDVPDKNCSCCGKEMAVIGEEKTEQLEFIPARFKVLEHVRLKRACSCCKEGVFIPKLPIWVVPLERSQPGPGLLAHIIVSKFQDHLPLHRQELIFARSRIDIPRQRMSDWMLGSAQILSPLAELIIKLIISGNYFQADETEIEVQVDDKQGKLHKGYFWAMLALPNLVGYRYDPSRAGTVPKEIFKDSEATIQTDFYAGYNTVFLPDKCQRLPCLAHIRRRFIKAQDSAKTDCQNILNLIANLYHVESDIKNKPPDDRKRIRLKRSFTEMKRLYRLIRQLRRGTLPESDLAKALNYAWQQRVEALRFFRDGQFELDNNAIERQMRAIAIGRKNYLFAGSHDGARSAAVFYTLLNTCKLNKVNSFDYIKDVLVRIHQPGTLDDLLPQNWKPRKID